MTTTSTLSITTTRPNRALRATAILALLSGGALIVDTVTTAVINRHFDPLDSTLFLIGFAGAWLTVITLAIYVSAGHRGGRRLLTAVAVVIVTAVVLGALSAAFDQLGRHLFSPSNIGLHGEWSFFTIGICELIIAVWAFRRQTTTNPLPAA